MKKSAGSIVNISSKAAVTGQGGTSGYAAANGERFSLTKEYSPEFDLIYVGTDDWGASGILHPLDSARIIPPDGANWLGGTYKFDPPSKAKGWLTAFNAEDGSVKWKFHTSSPILAGVTPTAGGLLFSADEKGLFYAFNAQNGKILWQISTGLPTGGGIVSYAANDKQYIAVVAGMKSPVWPGAPKKSEVLIYGL